MSFTTVIEPRELAQHLSDPAWVSVDCRFDLMNPDAGRQLYASGHVPGARYAHLNEDLSGPVTASTGRHPLPDPLEFARTIGRWGIGEQSQVVAYDDASGAIAARLWWMLRWVGHRAVAVLNGGYRAWLADGFPVASESPAIAPTRFRARAQSESTVSVDELMRSLADRAVVLVDARSSDRFAGQNETIDSKAGHVPGARNHPFLANLDAERRFLAPELLRERWLRTLANAPADRVVTMCGSGVTACHDLLAMEIAGFAGARLYPGSWSEWIRDETRPIATGDSAD